MRRALGVLGLVLAAALPALGQTAPDAAELTRLLNEFLAGASRHDAAVHERFWADDLIYTRSVGKRVDKAEVLADVRAAAAQAKPTDPRTTYTAEDVRIQQYGDAALVAFRLVGTTIRDGQAQVARFLNTGTFVKRNGQWRAVGWQATAAGVALQATFIGNMAVHLTDGKVALLTDFPYESGAFGYMAWSREAVPAGPRPLCLFTHSHKDHFSAALVREHCGSVLGPADVAKAAAGAAALEMKPEVRWEGLVIRPLATPHAGLEHYSYLVEWQGRRLYFTGDTEDLAALLAARDLDAAFVSPWLLDAAAKEGARVDARQVVVYHHRADQSVPPAEGRTVPRQGQALRFEPR
jgi:L-ascorbate metabolism protein UlaG (beta-lactamase superfamily)